MKVKMSLELVLLILVILVMFFKPVWLIRFGNSILGKLLLVMSIVLCTMQNTNCGLLAALLLVCLAEPLYEGFREGVETKEGDDGEVTDETDETDENCEMCSG